MRNSSVRFLHMADLHLGPCDPEKRDHDDPCHQCIKARILDGLQSRLTDPATRPDLLLLSGDLMEGDWCESRDDLESAAAPLDGFVRTAAENGVTVVGTVGEHDKGGIYGENAVSILRKKLGWGWLLRTGEVNRDAGVAVYAVEGRTGQRGLADDVRALRVRGSVISILLAHGDFKKVPRDEARSFRYYAMGHHHWTQMSPDGTAAYPGHLFSYWDGCGKAWPVHVLEGRIDANGGVELERISLTKETGSPDTRRLWVKAEHGEKSSGTLVFENAPVDVRERLGLRCQVKPDRAPGQFPTFYRQNARIPYRSTSQKRDIIRTILDAHPNDIFVTPASPKNRKGRVINYGRELKGNQFDEFVQKTTKATSKTM